ncbi:hypothetical protein Hanom_Chr04g00359981 [Helianthus anomalus]
MDYATSRNTFRSHSSIRAKPFNLHTEDKPWRVVHFFSWKKIF